MPPLWGQGLRCKRPRGSISDSRGAYSLTDSLTDRQTDSLTPLPFIYGWITMCKNWKMPRDR